jgi:CheY-like chemotaxis protein
MNNKKILLVDDEVNLRETITDLLVLNNYDVKTAENGLDALGILDYWIPDLIISDIMMPVMDGYSFHEIVKDSNMLNQIPFVFLTAKNDEEEREKCILNGADLFITKPFKIENLIKTIEVKIERFEKIKNAYNIPSNNNYYMHEINTPLNGILGPINLLINDKKSINENDLEKIYDSIKTSGERLHRTLKNSILYQNLINNKLEILNNSYSEILSEFLKVKDKIAHSDKRRFARIINNIHKSDIKINQEYLHFILFELMDNALTFSKKNRKIIISGKKFNSEYYEFIIQDYGIGFTENEIKKINAFQQFDREKREQQGLGLGLIMSKVLIQKIMGVFSIISHKDVGTTITIYFPLHIDNLE